MKMSTWLTSKVTEAVRCKKAAFKKQKSCSSKLNKKDCRFYQNKCILKIRQVNIGCEEHTAKNIKTTTKNFLKCITSRKLAQGEHRGERIAKSRQQDCRVTEGSLCVSCEQCVADTHAELLFSRRVLGEITQTEVTGDEILMINTIRVHALMHIVLV